MPFFAYILRCADGSYHTGHTREPTDHVDARRLGARSGWARHRRPVRLLWAEGFETRAGARAAEQRLKGWSRRRKEALVAANGGALHALAGGPARAGPGAVART